MPADHGAYLPTELEIGAACDAIRRGWSEDERRRRRHGMMPGSRSAKSGEAPPAWSVPTISVDAGVGALELA